MKEQKTKTEVGTESRLVVLKGVVFRQSVDCSMARIEDNRMAFFNLLKKNNYQHRIFSPGKV
jgi:hypothetical protein